jgi:hypothetical protein
MHPKIMWFKIREFVRSKYGKKNKVHELKNLPIIELHFSNNNPNKMEKILSIYIKNPSRMNIAPNNMELINREVNLGTEFYLICDASGLPIGCIGWQSWRNMAVNLIIDYKYRSKGMALASMLALMDLKKNQGINKFNVQVYRKNWRAQNLFFSLGFVLDKEKEYSENYISLTHYTYASAQASPIYTGSAEQQ